MFMYYIFACLRVFIAVGVGRRDLASETINPPRDARSTGLTLMDQVQRNTSLLGPRVPD